MDYTPELCCETLIFLRDMLHASYPRVMSYAEDGIKQIKTGDSTRCYDTFKMYLIKISNVVGHNTVHKLLLQPKNQAKKDLCVYIHGSSHVDKCCDSKCVRRECKIARDIRVHIDKKANGTSDCSKICSTCILLADIAKYQMKKVILNARFGIGEPGYVDLVDHSTRCESNACMQKYKTMTCDSVKRFLNHEKDCVDPECSCLYIDPILRYNKRERDDMPRLDSFDELTDLVIISGFDEGDLRKELMIRDDPPTPNKRRMIKPRVLSKEEMYVNSFGLSGGIYDD